MDYNYSFMLSIYSLIISILSFSLLLNSKQTWKKIGNLDVTNEQVTLDFPPTAREFLISYGTKNQSQSYGGGTVVIPVTEVKPCLLPIYDYSGYTGVIRIYNNADGRQLIMKIESGTFTGLCIVYYR